ncbi:primosomal protein N' [Bombilactobacillus folatiphilus]|uniref:Replication restart protein PriA n=1 Tax=Bombilactobacillus folatiphilus TaxID=2923362 RepID=A0ABY4PB44_9LACO|nr:primosomal protein N' [Bombilactobacillus folatiphilus]UQS82907.1 primosomal protein N' [Bombilactobacillus folatiphilus]
MVPLTAQSFIQPGVRVSVPFGRGGRLVQGFIVSLSQEIQFAGHVKEIKEILDLQPVLNPELLQLSDWLAQQTFAFRISCLQTMLPSIMRSKAQKLVVTQDEKIKNSAIFQGQSFLEWTADLPTEVQQQLASWQKQDLVWMQYQLKNHAHHVKQLVLQRLDFDYAALLQQISPVAKKQRQLVKIFVDSDLATISYADLVQKYQISNATANAAVKKGWFVKHNQVRLRNPIATTIFDTKPKQLTTEQQNAVQQIISANDRPILLEGVTGSGKTEVYLQVIQYYLNQGQTALMLVPEISLTPQMVQQVSGRFGEQVAVLHSGLSQGERYDEWQRINQGQAKVVVGARSAVFAPLQNLGIIIIDEEHEASYKQADNPRYHARDVALWRGRYHHCSVLLGSATPSLESRARAQKQVYQLLKLNKRVFNQALPAVHIIDMRQTKMLSDYLDLSQPILRGLQTTLQKREKAILLLNRRGFASYLICRSCGFVPQCPNCDISLTVHLKEQRLLCHYCGFSQTLPQICPQCHSAKLRYDGTGTQKVERELVELLPTAKIVRMDNDTTTRKGAHQKLLTTFDQQGDILLGTQMIAKGLDFPQVTFVGVINADTGLATSDFRASERTFQLLTQVSGRAGRAHKQGQVVIQTYNPDHYSIQLAAQQDYEQFYRREMNFRHQAQYPPYFYLIKLSVSHKLQAQAFKMAYNIAKQLRPLLLAREQLLGPTQPAIGRVKQRYYYQIVIKYRRNEQLFQVLHRIMNDVQQDSRQGFLVAIDHEPQQLE